MPLWFRYGGATYAERYFNDSLVKSGENTHWAKDWSVQNIPARGGLRPLEDLFAFNLTPEGGPDSEKMINEIGLVTAFIVDGNCAPVVEKHIALQAALEDGKDAEAVGDAAMALPAAVIAHETELRKFAGI